MSRTIKDLSGLRFGKVFVSHFSRIKDGRSHFMCLCDCGVEFESDGHNLNQGKVNTCGCSRSIGLAERNATHEMSYSTEYKSYSHAKDRCLNKKNKKYLDYGGRGIKFLFTSFSQFYSLLGPKPTTKHSLDRENNEGHYEPGNVRWATRKEQANNRRPKSVQRSHEDLLVAYANEAMGVL
jgi:hypothetical protein